MTIQEKARKIRAILTDVDGVLTDGGIIYDNAYNEFKRFNVKDGQIVSHLIRLGFIVGAITGRESDVVKKRMAELRFTFHRHGIKDKLAEYEEIKRTYRLEDEEIAYIDRSLYSVPMRFVRDTAGCTGIYEKGSRLYHPVQRW